MNLDRIGKIHTRFARLPLNIRSAPGVPGALQLAMQLDTYITSFEYAVTLHRFSTEQMHRIRAELERRRLDGSGLFWNTPEEDEKERLFMGWSQIAGRDGASSIHHFRHTMNDLNGALCKDPILQPLLNKEELGRAHDLFNKNFQRSESIRNAAQHLAEMQRKPQVANHKFEGEHDKDGIKVNASASVFIQGMMLGDQYTFTYGGQMLSYALNEESIQHLVDIEACMLGALPPSRE
jgi:hypothetical protein